MDNYVAVIIDYVFQLVEHGASIDNALKMGLVKLSRFENYMPVSEFWMTAELIQRFARIYKAK